MADGTKNPKTEEPTVEYLNHGVVEWAGNPLIEALPPVMKDFTELKKRMRSDVAHEPLPDSTSQFGRLYAIRRLKNLYLPTSQHLYVAQRIIELVYSGYVGRNPLQPAGCRLQHGERIQADQTVAMLAALSGMGKTTVIDIVTEILGPRLIVHRKYGEKLFHQSQIPILKITCHASATIKSFCVAALSHIDKIAGTDYVLEEGDARASAGVLLQTLEKALVAHNVGLLCIDEAHNFCALGDSGREKLLEDIVAMRECSRVPILMIGNHKLLTLTARSMALPRRLTEGGYMEFNRPENENDTDWKGLCSEIEKLQWVRNPQPLSEQAIRTLHSLTQGVTGILMTLWQQAQRLAVELEFDTVDETTLIDAYRTRLSPIHPALEALRRGPAGRGLEKYEDLIALTKLNPDLAP